MNNFNVMIISATRYVIDCRRGLKVRRSHSLFETCSDNFSPFRGSLTSISRLMAGKIVCICLAQAPGAVVLTESSPQVLPVSSRITKNSVDTRTSMDWSLRDTVHSSWKSMRSVLVDLTPL